MPRPRATGTAARNDVDQPKSAWKDKLTEQQLSRKRATDRQLVRENRNRARRTIALLQERIELLSNQQPDRVIADLLQENTNLEREKGALKDRLQSIYIAVGISREDTHELISKSASEDTESSSSGCKSGVDNSGPLEIPPPPPSNPQNGKNIVIGSNNEHEQLPECQNEQDLVRELNLRTALPGFPSPFPGIYANMDQISGVVNFCDDEFIESIMLWKLRYPSASSVFELASHLYHVHRPPNRLTQNKLSLITSTPSLLQLLIDDLDSPQLGLDLAATTPPSLVVPDTSVTTVKRELIVCAFEAIRPWKYRSRLARITMFWALYRILNVSLFLIHIDRKRYQVAELY